MPTAARKAVLSGVGDEPTPDSHGVRIGAAIA
jgi:hypothetical protein